MDTCVFPICYFSQSLLRSSALLCLLQGKFIKLCTAVPRSLTLEPLGGEEAPTAGTDIAFICNSCNPQLESDRRISGYVRAIRGGPGKVEVGENIAVPPPDLVRNELAVDVQLDALPPELSAQNFCGVGQSVEVVLGS